MAIPLNNHDITGVFALGQWFKVQRGTFYIDAYNLRVWHTDEEDKVSIYADLHDDYELGALYEGNQPEFRSGHYSASRGTYQTPQGNCACCFFDEETGERISFSLMEVRAFREGPR